MRLTLLTDSTSMQLPAEKIFINTQMSGLI